MFSSGRIEAHGDVRALLGRQPVQARQAIRNILVGKLTFVPMVLDGVAVGYRFTGEATFTRLLAGEAGSATPRLSLTPASARG